MALTAPALGPLAWLLRVLGPLALALAVTWSLDRMCRRKGLLPPGFRRPWRRLAAAALVLFILWVGIFAPLGTIGLPQPKLDLSSISTPRLFLLHGLLVAVVLGWFVLGFAGVRARPPRAAEALAGGGDRDHGNADGAPAAVAAAAAAGAPTGAPEVVEAGDVAAAGSPAAGEPATERWAGWDAERLPVAPTVAESLPGPAPPASAAPAPAAPAAAGRPSFVRTLAAQLGLVAPSVPREVLIGLALGACAWGAVLLALFVAALAIYAVGGEKALPKPSAIVPWIASLPVLVRLMVSLSAGVVEEVFFRGFLQPRIGIALSTGCFVLAHLSYGQPFMLIGITLLSLIYAFLVRWRQTIWPAIAAHALFDGVQLLVIIPLAMKWVRPSPGTLAWIW